MLLVSQCFTPFFKLFLLDEDESSISQNPSHQSIQEIERCFAQSDPSACSQCYQHPLRAPTGLFSPLLVGHSTQTFASNVTNNNVTTSNTHSFMKRRRTSSPSSTTSPFRSSIVHSINSSLVPSSWLAPAFHHFPAHRKSSLTIWLLFVSKTMLHSENFIQHFAFVCGVMYYVHFSKYTMYYTMPKK